MLGGKEEERKGGDCTTALLQLKVSFMHRKFA
jgi:hypothetical protein